MDREIDAGACATCTLTITALQPGNLLIRDIVLTCIDLHERYGRCYCYFPSFCIFYEVFIVFFHCILQ